jgi:mannose-6-phosphate isomerase-like protein (cupin superfamily)
VIVVRTCVPTGRRRVSRRARELCDGQGRPGEKLAGLDEPFRPGIVGYLNDYKLVVVKVHGAFVWHKHDDTDDFFLVLRGRITIQLRDRDVELREGELFVVPRGVEHCPKADEDAHVLLIEPRGTANTGDAGGDLTAEEMEI